MKFKIIVPIAVAVLIAVAAYVYLPIKDSLKNSFSVRSSSTVNVSTGSLYQGNTVYGAAMNLAWNDLSETIVHGTIDLSVKNPRAQKLADTFNSAPFTKHDLDAASYYIKSGYGQSTVDTINRESRQKFPDKSFGDLTVNLSDRDIIAYAYFLKKVEYPVEFSEDEVFFMNESVKGFRAKNEQERSNVGIVSYRDEDHFLLKLILKDNADELYLGKGYDMSDPDAVIRTIHQSRDALESMGEDDRFQMPKLHLDHERTYDDLVGSILKNQGFEDKEIQAMLEKIKFDLDHKGVRVENEASMMVGTTSVQPIQRHKNLIFDKPFWVVMKRASSERPYFVLGVNNTAVMVK
ncbi:MAG: hypothetical protein AAB416_01760 [Patescibacteria group bacterium]